MKKILLSLFLTLFIAPFAFADTAHQAKEYQIVSAKDSSFAGRTRSQIFIISPAAKTLKERADTARIAAVDYAVKNGTKVVTAFLMPFKEAEGTGYYYARVNYWADGCGNSGKACNDKLWEEYATDHQLTDIELKVAQEYYKNQDKFLDQDGLPDEGKLIKYIAKKLKISPKKAELTMLLLDKIE